MIEMKTLKRSKIQKIAKLAVLADLHTPYLVLLHKKNLKEHK